MKDGPEHGGLLTTATPNGRRVVLYPLLFGAARLAIEKNRGVEDKGDGGFDYAFDYPSVEHAKEALADWDGVGDPPGFTKAHRPASKEASA